MELLHILILIVSFVFLLFLGVPISFRIGLCTPPVGSVLFIGCGIAGTSIARVLKPLLPLFLAMLAAFLLITFIPEISMFLPKVFGY